MIKRNINKGFGLLELMFSLVVIVAILLVAGRYYQVTSTSRSVNEAGNIVQAIYTASATYYDNIGDLPKDDLMTALTENALLPANFSHTDFKNPWGGDVKVETSKDLKSVKISMSDLPDKACNNLVAQLSARKAFNLNNPTCTSKGEFTVDADISS